MPGSAARRESWLRKDRHAVTHYVQATELLRYVRWIHKAYDTSSLLLTVLTELKAMPCLAVQQHFVGKDYHD